MRLFDDGLSPDALRRLVVSLIINEQNGLLKRGLIRMDQTLAGLVHGKSSAEIDAIPVTEDVLGFDSLGTLDLILSLNRFFQLSKSGVEDYLLIKRRIGDWISLLSQHRRIVGPDWSFAFETSGSTDAPRLINHRAHLLWTEMECQATGPFQHLRAPARIILLVPPHHIYGFLFGCVLPDLLGLEVIDLHLAAPSAAFRFARRGDLIVGTPFNWDILRKTELQFCDGVYGVTSAGPSSPRTWTTIEASNLTQMTEIYGATETGGIGSRTDQSAPFDLLPHLEVIDGKIVRCQEGIPLPVQDRFEWADPRAFHLQGRLDHVVQVAGVNVSPQVVRKQMLRVDGVEEASVRLGKDRLRAFVVPRRGADETELRERLQAHMAATFDAPARPSSITFGAQIPRNDMGKPADWA